MELTVQCMIRNEPFIYYTIMSVYDYATTILLYDTGSYDDYTLKDIETILEIDKKRDNKIIYKKIKLETDETKWTIETLGAEIQKNKGKFGIGKCRQLMIEDTKTEWFMILDGDEVHYKKSMDILVNNFIPNVADNIIAVAVPLIWLTDTNTYYNISDSARFFRTNRVKMDGKSPDEWHCYKNTGKRIVREDPNRVVANVKYYTHWEVYLKPWRRLHRIKKFNVFKDKLPEVMIENDFYIKRYKEMQKNGKK